VTDEPDVKVFPHGLEDEFEVREDEEGSRIRIPNGPPTAVITHRGIRFVLRFAEGDFAGEGPLQELRVYPDADPLEPRVLRRFSPHAEIYVAFARSAMRILKPEGTRESRHADFIGAAEALQQIAGPGRGLSDAFYATIARHYEALVSEGEQHPIKTLSESHSVTISAASRWVKGARDRGYLTEDARPASKREKVKA
jgi:hypothetical protein